MKKIIGIIIGIIVVLLLILKIFGNYNSNNILRNEACFEVFVDSKFNYDDFFELPRGTFDTEKHLFICKLPVETEGFRPSYVYVRTDIESIDCNVEFEKSKYVQYQPYELKGTDFELLMVDKNTNLSVLNSHLLVEDLFLAKKTFQYDYSKGKINRLVISKYGIHEYCK
ncbi:MAG: hypothetical protein V4666_09960 [Bacteroidota bacterium]